MPGGTRRRIRWGERAFGALLALYPREFRDEYGREVAMVFKDRYREAARAWQRAQVWLEACGGVLKEAPREHLQTLLYDLRFAGRMIRKSPGFATTVVLTLALGIGANAAVFQLINAVRLRTLPVRDPGELAEVRIAGGNQGFGLNPSRYGGLTQPVWHELRLRQESFAGVLAWGLRELYVGEHPEQRQVDGIAVSAEFFRVLGIQPWRGRLIGPPEDTDTTPCPARRVVVSYGYWQREMGGSPIDRDTRLRLNGEQHEVIGVTPPGFFGLAVGESFDIAVPLCRPNELRHDVFDVAVMGRLRPGWTIEQASAHVDALSQPIFETTAPAGYRAQYIQQFKAFRLAAYAASTGVSQLRSTYDTSLTLLLAMTGLVLLIACANLANLMLARAIGRTREVSVRLALGASRTRVLREFLAESLLLAAIGGALSLALAQGLGRALIWGLSTRAGAPTLSLAIDWRVLAFTGLVGMATCLVFGIVPGVRATRTEPAAALQAGGRTMTGGARRFSTPRVLVVAQVAVSVVLLVAALLFVRSFRNLMTFDAGMRQADLTVGTFEFGRAGVAPERFSDVRLTLLSEVKTVPGVLDAATTTHVPLVGGAWSHFVQVGEVEGWTRFAAVSPGYFAVMDIPIVEGRDLTPRDTEGAVPVAVVNETFVRSWLDGRGAIGQLFRTHPEPGYPSTVYEIVGVIPDTKYNDLRSEPQPMAFAPDSQYPAGRPAARMMIHSSIDPALAIARIRDRIRKAHPDVVMEFIDFQAWIRDGLVRDRLLATLAGFFGAVAVLLATVGLYGLIAFTVAERRQEIGLRAALGAHPGRIIALVMRDAGWLMGVGLLVGAGLALLVGRSAARLLFGLTPHDPATLLAAGLLLTGIAAAASFIPARRASRLDPLTALRDE